MTRKGGGRESGPTGDTGVVRATETGRAAANPAVESLADFIIPKAAVNPAAHSQRWEAFLCQCACKEDHERIRELEVQLEEQKAKMWVHPTGQSCVDAERRAERAEAAFRAEHEVQERGAKALVEALTRVKDLEEMMVLSDAVAKALEIRLQKALHARDERSPPRP